MTRLTKRKRTVTLRRLREQQHELAKVRAQLQRLHDEQKQGFDPRQCEGPPDEHEQRDRVWASLLT